MHAPLHCGNWHIPRVANHHLAGMPDGGGAWEGVNLRIRTSRHVGELVRECAQTGPQDKADPWPKSCLRQQVLCRSVCLQKQIVSCHIKYFPEPSAQSPEPTYQNQHSKLRFKLAEL